MQVYEKFELAKKYFNEYKYKKSLNLLIMCMKDKSLYEKSLFEIIKVYVEMKEYDKAIFFANKYLKKCKDEYLKDIVKMSLAKVYKYIMKEYKSIELLDSINNMTVLNSEEFNTERLNVSYSMFNKYFAVNEFSGDVQLLNKEFLKIKNLIPNDKKILFYIIRVSNFFHDYKFTKKTIEKYKKKFNYEDIFYDNAILNEYEIASKKIRLRSKPRVMWIATSSKCNLSCIMCHAKESNFVLSKQNIKDIYNYMPYLERIIWWGGEPTISDLFYEMLEYSLQYKNIQHTIITNGQYMPKKFLDIVSKNNMEVVVSIDSADKKIYETIRRGASFNKLKENLSKLSKVLNTEFIKIFVVIMKQNKKQLQAICNFVGKFGIKNIVLLPLANELDSASKYNLKLEDLSLMNNQIKKIKDVNVFNSTSIIKKYKNNESFLCGFCHNPWVEITFSYFSTLTSSNLCSFFGNPVFKLTKWNMKSYWNSKTMQNLRKKIIKEKCCSVYCPKANTRLK